VLSTRVKTNPTTQFPAANVTSCTAGTGGTILSTAPGQPTVLPSPGFNYSLILSKTGMLAIIKQVPCRDMCSCLARQSH
jgi:hypothetical protein